MNTFPSKHFVEYPSGRPARQHGATLIMVLIIMLLTMTAVMGGYRLANLNETVLSNASDYNRAVAAAEALIRDAEADIRGRLPPYTVQSDGSLGTVCRPDTNNTLVTTAGYVGCRNQGGGRAYFPRSTEDFDAVETVVASATTTPRCQDGICVPTNITYSPLIENNLTAMTPVAATYGQYTRNGLTAPGVSGNPILTASPAQAWYWVEVYKYTASLASSSTTANNLVPDPSVPFIYRITAVAQGLKPGTQAVIKTTFVPYPASQGQ